MQDPLGNTLGLFDRVRALFDENGEFVPAEPSDGVRAADCLVEATGDLPEEHIAGSVAEAVIDGLEPVEVEEDDADVESRAGISAQRVLHPVAEEGPVGEVGEPVVERLMLQLRLGAHAFADVVQVHHDPADVGIVAEVDKPGTEPQVVSICVLEAQLLLEHLTLARPAALEHGAGVAAFCGNEEPEEALADRRRAGAPEQR